MQAGVAVREFLARLDRAVAEVVVAAAIAAAVARILEAGQAAVHQLAERVAARAGQVVVVARDRIADGEDRRWHIVRRRVAGIGVGEGTIAVEDRFAIGQLEAEHGVEIAPLAATDQLHALVVAAALLGTADLHADVESFVFLLQHDVDDAGDRIGAVHGRGAAAEDLDAIDHHARDVGEVDRVDRAVVSDRIVGDAMAVDEHQGVVRPESAQVQHIRRRGERAAEILALHAARVLRDLGQHVEHVTETAGVDVGTLDHGDRCRPLDLRARDARAGDRDLLELARLCGRRRVVLRQREQGQQGGDQSDAAGA